MTASAEPAPPAAGARDPTIDRFRGLAILAMVIANFLEHVRAVPGRLRHAPDVGITAEASALVFLVPAVPWWHLEAPLWLTALQGAAFVAALHAFASWLRRRSVIVSL